MFVLFILVLYEFKLLSKLFSESKSYLLIFILDLLCEIKEFKLFVLEKNPELILLISFSDLKILDWLKSSFKSFVFILYFLIFSSEEFIKERLVVDIFKVENWLYLLNDLLFLFASFNSVNSFSNSLIFLILSFDLSFILLFNWSIIPFFKSRLLFNSIFVHSNSFTLLFNFLYFPWKNYFHFL